MAHQNVFMVQHFERRLKRLVGGHAIAYRTPDEAVARVERDIDLFAGIVAYEVVIDTNSGEAVEEPKVIIRLGEVGPGFQSFDEKAAA